MEVEGISAAAFGDVKIPLDETSVLSSMSLDATVIGHYVVVSVEAKLGDMVAAPGDGVAGPRVASLVKSTGVMCTTLTSCYIDC